MTTVVHHEEEAPLAPDYYWMKMFTLLIQPEFDSEVSPSSLAARVTSLLVDHEDPGEIFAQHQIGGLNIVDAVTLGASREAWDDKPTRIIRLRQLADMYRRKEEQRALELLNKKLQVQIDEEYILPTTRAVFQPTFNLDFFSAVPHEPGFSVVLPPDDYQPPISWNFDLRLDRPFRPFHFKHGMLGFSPESASIWIGRSGSLDIWCLYVREDDLTPGAKLAKAGKTFSSPTQLSRKHLRQFYSWILYLLCQIDYPGIWCNGDELYNVDLEASTADWDFAIGFR